MPRFLRWVNGLFGPAAPSPQDVSPSRQITDPGIQAETRDPALLEEASGFLQESLFSWLLDVEPEQLEQTDKHAEEIITQLDSLISSGHLEELPRQPLILPMLLKTLAKDNTNRDEVVTIILRDPALTDRVLKAANSPYFRVGSQHIESVDQAVFMMGNEGIRNVVLASIMRPLLAPRESGERQFSERVWQWGMVCGRSAESIARLNGSDGGALFLLGLLPALSFVILRQQTQLLYRDRCGKQTLPPSLLYAVIRRFSWATAQLVAQKWSLPPNFRSHLMSVKRPTPENRSTPLNDGILLATREVLQHAHQPNLTEQQLSQVLPLEDSQLHRIQGVIAKMLEDNERPAG